MTTPETRRVELEPLVLSFDERASESEETLESEADMRELSAYGFDSDTETLVGIGSSRSAEESLVGPFDTSDRTLVGIGPLESVEGVEIFDDGELVDGVELAESVARAEHVEAAAGFEAASHPPEAEAIPASVPMPQSEPPGPFVTSNDEDRAPLRLPMKTRGPLLLAASAALVALAAFAVVRGVVPRANAPRAHAAALAAGLAAPSIADTPRASNAWFEKSAAISAEAPAVESPTTPGPMNSERAAPLATTLHEKPLVPAGRPATTRLPGSEMLGALDVTANPPSNVVIDGRPLGKTPRVVQLPSGPHTVMFVHPERGRMSVTVNVRAGRTTSASADY